MRKISGSLKNTSELKINIDIQFELLLDQTICSTNFVLLRCFYAKEVIYLKYLVIFDFPNIC